MAEQLARAAAAGCSARHRTHPSPLPTRSPSHRRSPDVAALAPSSALLPPPATGAEHARFHIRLNARTRRGQHRSFTCGRKRRLIPYLSRAFGGPRPYAAAFLQRRGDGHRKLVCLGGCLIRHGELRLALFDDRDRLVDASRGPARATLPCPWLRCRSAVLAVARCGAARRPGGARGLISGDGRTPYTTSWIQPPAATRNSCCASWAARSPP
jgi:hypothetical protein